jgi:hypothetical protein
MTSLSETPAADPGARVAIHIIRPLPHGTGLHGCYAEYDILKSAIIACLTADGEPHARKTPILFPVVIL